MSGLWYYAEGEETRGPITLVELISNLSRISDATKVPVWRTGFEDWKVAEDVHEIAEQLFRPPPLTPKPPPQKPKAPPANDDCLIRSLNTDRITLLAKISCRTVQHGPHINSLPTHVPLPPNLNPIAVVTLYSAAVRDEDELKEVMEALEFAEARLKVR